MSSIFKYASFPNSRNEARPATQSAVNYHVEIHNLDSAGPYVKVVEENQNLTYVLLENLSDEISFFYIYAVTIADNPMVTARFGTTNQLAYNPTTETLYQKQDVGTNTNWIVVLIEDVGSVVLPFQTASLESPQDIYAAGNQNDPGVSISIAVDEGSG